MSLRELPEIGQQLFLHYKRQEAVVEQTFPAVGHHRLAILPNQDALLERLLAIFSVQSRYAAANTTIISQGVFQTVKTLVENGDTGQAQTRLVQSGVAQDAAASVIEAMGAPTFSGTIALLRCVGTEVVDARNPLIVQGPTAAWSIFQSTPGEDGLRLLPVTSDLLRGQIQGWLDDLQ